MSKEISSEQLEQALLRARYQENTTDSQVSGLTVQMGWGFIQGDNTSAIEKTVTFPAAFSNPPIVLATFISAVATSGGTPTSTSNFVTAWSNFSGLAVDAITSSNFEVRLLSTGANHSASFYFGYTWLAIGVV